MAQKTALMLLVLYALLIVGLLVLAVAGAHLYSAALEAKDLHAEQRSALSYVQTQVASCRGRVTLENENTLCLTEPGYVTRVYLYGDTLCTQMTQADKIPDLAKGDRICDLEEFTLTWVSPELLRVATNRGTAYIHCGGGGVNE